MVVGLRLRLEVLDDRLDLGLGHEARPGCAWAWPTPASRTACRPRPTSFSAPGWSRMTRLSIALATVNAMRLVMLALMSPVTTLASGRCVATMRWMPAARASCAMRQIESSTSFAATIMRSASSSMTMTRYGSSLDALGALPVLDHRVVRADIARARALQDLEAPLHLRDRPRKRAGGLLRLGDDRHVEVRDAVVEREFDALRVDEDEPHLGGRRSAS